MSEKTIERKLSPLFTWRSQICSDEGPKDPTTRLVLLVLSLYMSEKGDSCFPSIERLTHDSALSNRSVRTHLKLAVKSGWIVRRLREHRQGRGWRAYEYQASIGQRAAADAARQHQGPVDQTLTDDMRQQMPEHDEVRHLTTRGAASDDLNVRQEVPLNTSLNTSRRRQEKPAQKCASEKPPTDPSTEQWLEKPESMLNPAERAARTHYLEQMQQGVTQSDNADKDQKHTKRSGDPKADPRAA